METCHWWQIHQIRLRNLVHGSKDARDSAAECHVEVGTGEADPGGAMEDGKWLTAELPNSVTKHVWLTHQQLVWKPASVASINEAEHKQFVGLTVAELLVLLVLLVDGWGWGVTDRDRLCLLFCQQLFNDSGTTAASTKMNLFSSFLSSCCFTKQMLTFGVWAAVGHTFSQGSNQSWINSRSPTDWQAGSCINGCHVPSCTPLGVPAANGEPWWGGDAGRPLSIKP